MNYEFHVGDYVETWDGEVGYITDINLAYSDVDVPYFDWITKEGKSLRQRIGLWAEQFGFVLVDTFRRIGAYDFTKKEKKKIEMISDCNKHIFANAIKSNNQLVRTVSDDILNKINELVDAVNKLMDDYDEHIEAHRQTNR